MASVNANLEDLRSLQNSEDVEEFLKEKNLEWKPIGGKTNNQGVIEMGSDPANALMERVTNSIDAVVERAFIESDLEEQPESPREAVQKLFDIPKTGFGEFSDQEIRRLADKLSIRMKESGKSQDRPVIEIEDYGVGQPPIRFEDTFLSLNNDNKVDKKYLIGKYGQGGTNTFSFAEYTIIISRDHQGGNIGWTIIRYNDMRDAEVERVTGTYQYCTLTDGSIPTISEEEADGWTGSEVRLIEYDASGFSNQLAPGKTIYSAANLKMFGSIYPFGAYDYRSERFEAISEDGKYRSITGNRNRLNKTEKVEESVEFQIDLDELGEVRAKCWVIHEKDDVTNYIKKSEPVIFTLYGQVHHAEDKRFLDDTDQNFLKNRLVVEVDCDNLSKHGRRALLSSTRDRAKEGEDYDRMVEKLQKSLKTNERINSLNEEYRQRAMNENASEEEEKAKKLLSDLIEGRRKETGDEGREPGGDLEDPPTQEPPAQEYNPVDPVEDLKEEPTYIEIKNSDDPMEAEQGQTLNVKVEIDAKDKFEFLDEGEIRVEIEIDEDVFGEVSETSLSKGRKTFQLEVDEDAEIGLEGTIVAVAEWENGYLADQRDVEVVEPSTTQETGQESQVQYPEITFVTEESEEQIDSLGWDETDVVMYDDRDDEVGKVFVSLFNENVKKIREKVESTEDTVNRYTRQYAAYMSFFEVMRKTQDEGDEADVDEDYVKREQNRVARVLMQSIAKSVDPEDLVA